MPNTTLANYLKCQAISQGLQGFGQRQCLLSGRRGSSNDGTVGSPVRVNMDAPFKFVPILGIGTITLRGRATMRLEQTTDPSRPSPAKGHLSGVGACSCGERPVARSKERGQVVVVFALLIPVIFALGAIVIDIGNWYVHKRHLQTQVDAAAFAGANDFFGLQSALSKTLRLRRTSRSRRTRWSTQATRYALLPRSTRCIRRDRTKHQLQEPADVRAVINSATWWVQGDVTDGSTLDNTLDPDGDPATPGDPCTTKTLDVKATDDEAPNLWGLIPLILPARRRRQGSKSSRSSRRAGMLPFAVPEVDPARVAALFVNENTGVKYDFQYLCAQERARTRRSRTGRPAPGETRERRHSG